MIVIAEEWRDIPDWEGLYQASSLGRIRSLPKEVPAAGGATRIRPSRILRPVVNKRTGRRQVTLMHGSCVRRRYAQVHRLVAEAFLGHPPSNKHQCAHIDGDKNNNIVSNLRWATPVENNADKLRHGTHQWGERIGTSKLTSAQVRLMRSVKDQFSSKEIGAIFGIAPSHAWKILRGDIWTYA